MFKRVNLIAVLLLLMAVATNGQLIGIDMGTEYTKVAMIHAGAGKAFTIVENMKSERKIETAVSFLNSERFYESEAVSKRLRSTKNSFLYTKLFLEQLNNQTGLIELSRQLLLDHTVNPESKGLVEFILEGFSLGDEQKSITISLEQVFGMIFKYIKQLSEKHGKAKVRDCVIVMPNYWTLDQRIIILNALAIADLYPLSIIGENTAAALQYAMNRQDNTTHRVVFYNLGANALQVSLAEFRVANDSKSKTPVETVHIIDEFGLPRVGGLEIDALLAAHFTKIFDNKYKKPLTPRARVKLLEESEKVKEVLSANKDATLIIQELVGGVDFQSKITRTEFQGIISDILEKITYPVVPFLRSNDIRPKEVNNVELIGGSVRIPKLQSILNQTFQGVDVGTHINGDESMALGAVFYAANSSKKFKVKGLQLFDGFNFEIRMVMRNLDKSIEQGKEGYISKNITLFKKKNRFGLIKDVGMKCTQNLEIEFWKEDDTGLELIKTVTLNNITSYKNNQKFADMTPKLMISVQTDPLTIVTIDEAKLTVTREEQVSYVEQVRKGKKPKKEKKTEANKEDDNQQPKTDATEDKKDEPPMEVKEDNSNTTSRNGTNSTTTKKKVKEEQEQWEYETVERKKSVQKTHNMKLSQSEKWHLRERLGGEKLQEAQKLLSRFEKQEERKKKLAQSRNKLEAAIYEAKDLLENDQFKEFSTEAERKVIEQQLADKETKVDEKNTAEGYGELYRDFIQHIQKVKNRIVEERQRDEIKKRTYESLDDYRNKYKKLEADNSWVSTQQKEPLLSLIDSTQKQLEDLYEQQSTKSKNQDPVVWNKQVLKKLDVVKDMYFSIKNIPKPKPKKQEKKEQKKEDTKTDTKDDSSANDQL